MNPLGASVAYLMLAAGGVFVAVGCSVDKNRPVLARVTGKVSFNNKPLPKAQIYFFPEKTGIRTALGETDDQGRYTLWTYELGDGAPVGKHRVTINLRGAPERIPLHASAKAEGKGEAYYEQATMEGKPLIPPKYFNAMTSGLTAEVLVGKTNTCDFGLTGNVPK